MTIKLKEVSAMAVTDYKRFSRRERKAIAKLKGVDFPPQYNGVRPISFVAYIAGFRNDPVTGKSLLPRRLRNHPLNKAVTE